jgi:hypothetical protein
MALTNKLLAHANKNSQSDCCSSAAPSHDFCRPAIGRGLHIILRGVVQDRSTTTVPRCRYPEYLAQNRSLPKIRIYDYDGRY